jgi:hypothetical protein
MFGYRTALLPELPFAIAIEAFKFSSSFFEVGGNSNLIKVVFIKPSLAKSCIILFIPQKERKMILMVYILLNSYA